MASTMVKILSLILALCIALPISSATDYTVGDTAGWGLGANYNDWASGKTFNVGDTLVFNYDSSHSVAEVGPSDYSACSTANAISIESSGATTVPLKTAGTHYYVCGVPSHCAGGMKLSMTVKPSSTSTSSGTSSGTGTGTSATPGAVTTNTTPSTTTTTSYSSGNALMVPSFVALLVGLCVMFLIN